MSSMPFLRGFVRRSGRHHSRHARVGFFDDPDGVSPPVFLLACAVFGVGLIFGGSGGSFGDVIAQLLSLPLIVLAGARWSTRCLQPADWLVLALLMGIVLLACIQLVPLPMHTWATLPGRTQLLAQMHAVGAVPVWTSLSLNPLATERALEWTLPAVALFLAVRWMSPRQQRAMVLALFVAAIAMTIMDVLFRNADANADVNAAALLAKAYQTAGGLVATTRATPVRDSAMTGLFSNHNHFGTFLAMTIPLMAAAGLRLWSDLKDRKRGSKGSATVAAMVLLGLSAMSLLAAAFETHSRAALLLGGLSLLGSSALLRDLRLGRRVLWGIAGGAFVIVLIAGVTAGGEAFERFGNGIDNDLRWQIHATTLDAARHFGPMGSGLGTFVEAYQAVPPQEGMLPAYINRAHGDYHELWLETGIPGMVLIGLFFAWFGGAALRAWRVPADEQADPQARPGRERLLARAASLSIFLLLIHSYVEYPLRKTAILAVLGLCCALLSGNEKREGRRIAKSSTQGVEAGQPVPEAVAGGGVAASGDA